MGAQHTPGPWTAENAETREDGAEGSAWGVVAGSRIVILHDFVGEADAQLIAAAPDMLWALREIVELLDAYSDVDDGSDGPVPNKAMSMMVQIESLIAKAEGR